MSTRSLRVGLLLNSLDVPAWAYRMVEEIHGADYADISLVILNGTSGQSVEPRRSWTLHQLAAAALRRILSAILDVLVVRRHCLPNAFESRDLGPLLRGVETWVETPVQTHLVDRFSEEQVDRIQGHDLDVLIRLGFRILKGRILSAARYGVWSYHHGDNTVNRGGPAGFWEVMEGRPETGTILQILTNDLDNGQVLYRSWAQTQPYVDSNRNAMYWKTLSFIPRVLKALHLEGPSYLERQIQRCSVEPNFYSNRLYVRPTNFETFQIISRKLTSKICNRLTSTVWFDQWILKFQLKASLSSSFWRFKTMLPPRDRFWADPHVIRRNGKYFIFIEEYPYALRKGHISCIEMDDSGNWKPPKCVLIRPYHLSYPFVFTYSNDLYMIPESAANRTIELYKCVDFPGTWEFQHNLMEDVIAVDTTLLEVNDRWWLFSNIVEHEGASSCDELFLFSADSPLRRDWKPHRRNPIVSDVKSARPAGRFVQHGGRLLRIGQNCSQRYGRGMAIREIKRIDELEYEEVAAADIEPNWSPEVFGTHTFCHESGLTVIDAIIRRRRC